MLSMSCGSPTVKTTACLVAASARWCRRWHRADTAIRTASEKCAGSTMTRSESLHRRRTRLTRSHQVPVEEPLQPPVEVELRARRAGSRAPRWGRSRTRTSCRAAQLARRAARTASGSRARRARRGRSGAAPGRSRAGGTASRRGTPRAPATAWPIIRSRSWTPPRSPCAHEVTMSQSPYLAHRAAEAVLGVVGRPRSSAM